MADVPDEEAAVRKRHLEVWRKILRARTTARVGSDDIFDQANGRGQKQSASIHVSEERSWFHFRKTSGKLIERM
jgi:hypothetical protein